MKVFYSFCGKDDMDRIRGIVDMLMVHSTQQPTGVIAKREWENLKEKGEDAIHNWVKKELEGTSVTVVLLGTNTLEDRFVQYQICESLRRGNAVIGVYIKDRKDKQSDSTAEKCNLHKVVAYYKYGTPIYFDYINDGIYDYESEDGGSNLDMWVEQAAEQRSANEYDARWKRIKMTPTNVAS